MSVVARVTASIRIGGGVARRSDIDHPGWSTFAPGCFMPTACSAGEESEHEVESDDRDDGLHPPRGSSGEDGVDHETDHPDEAKQREQRHERDQAAR